jgi:hypothetical protein
MVESGRRQYDNTSELQILKSGIVIMKKQKYKEGSCFLINLCDSSHCFGRIVKGLNVCIYDYNSDISSTNIAKELEKVITLPVLFYDKLADGAIKKGEFEVVGHFEVSQEEVDAIPPVFTQDVLNIDDCILYYVDGRVIPCSKEDCIGLEKYGMSDSIHIIDRLEDYYVHKQSSVPESAKVRLK